MITDLLNKIVVGVISAGWGLQIAIREEEMFQKEKIIGH